MGLAAILATQLWWVPATNFTGFDEWPIIDLVSRGIIDAPHGNRPVHMLWLLPAALGPHTLTPYVLLHALYSLLLGVAVFQIMRRLAPARPWLWLLTATFSMVWGPGDLTRLSTLERVGYTAFAFATLLALWLLLESWRRGSPSLLAVATLVSFLAARSYEAVVPLLACAPLALLRLPGGRRARLRIWVTAWEGVVALATVLIVLPAFSPHGPLAYQMEVLGLDANPLHVAQRLVQQYVFHLAPLALSPWSELGVAPVPIAVAVFAIVATAWRRLVPEPAADPATRVFDTGCLLVGTLWAGLSYGMLALTPAKPTALRMQSLSAPGMALLLAAGVTLLASWLPVRWRHAGTGLMAAWIVAVGTGRAVAMQKTWDAASVYPTQMRMLSELTRQVPDVRPHTLLLLLDEGHAWRATYGFMHAARFLYQGRADGLVSGAWNALYPAFFTPQGIRIEPWPVLRKPWHTDVTLHGYDEVVVLRDTAGGEVDLFEDWPSSLPALPQGARYAPRSRIVTGGAELPERAILTAH